MQQRLRGLWHLFLCSIGKHEYDYHWNKFKEKYYVYCSRCLIQKKEKTKLPLMILFEIKATEAGQEAIYLLSEDLFKEEIK